MTTHPTAPTTGDRPPSSMPRRLAIWLFPRRRTRLGLLLAAPLGWLVIVYLGSLFVLLMSAFWAQDGFTGNVEPFAWSFKAFDTLFTEEVYRTVAIRTLGMAALVTVTDALLAFPIAYYMARVASPRVRGALLVAVLLPLWASYLVKVFAWRTILQGNGLLEWVFEPLGSARPWQGDKELSNAWLVLTYLWLPYMILPSTPASSGSRRRCLEASADLGGRAERRSGG